MEHVAVGYKASTDIIFVPFLKDLIITKDFINTNRDDENVNGVIVINKIILYFLT